jgi:uncharacterized membrane protein YkvA (DUF1232 family)
VTVWQSGLVAVGALAAAYAGLVATLALTGRRSGARALARFIPDCSVLFGRLLSDPRVSRSHRFLLMGLVAYLSVPFDLVPDFIPVAGQLDDAIVALLVLRFVLRAGRADLIREHWPGPETSLAAVLRLAGLPAH